MTGRGRERGWIRSTVVALAGLALVEAAGCQSNDNSSNDELLALLHDDPLTTVAVGAVTASDGGVMTGVGREKRNRHRRKVGRGRGRDHRRRRHRRNDRVRRKGMIFDGGSGGSPGVDGGGTEAPAASVGARRISSVRSGSGASTTAIRMRTNLYDVVPTATPPFAP